MILPFLTSPTLGALVRDGERRFKRAKLTYGHGTTNAFDEAAFMALEGLGFPVDSLHENWKRRITDDEKLQILALYDKRIAMRKPASYLLNKAYIQGAPFYVDERVIVPRSFIAEILYSPHSPAPRPIQVNRALDLCTGSGCLAILLAKLYPKAQIDATDLSPDALEVARRNVADYFLNNRVALHQGDLFAPLSRGTRYDLIVANPPYVDAEGMEDLPPEFMAEPEMALAAGADGLDIVQRIIDEAPDWLSENGMLICEIGRCGPALQNAYPGKAFSWLETEHSSGEVFFISRDELIGMG